MRASGPAATRRSSGYSMYRRRWSPDVSLAATRPIPFGGHEHGLIADLLRAISITLTALQATIRLTGRSTFRNGASSSPDPSPRCSLRPSPQSRPVTTQSEPASHPMETRPLFSRAGAIRSCSQASGTGEVVPSAFPATRPSSGRADPSLPSLYHSTSQTTQAAQPLVPEGSVKSP